VSHAARAARKFRSNLLLASLLVLVPIGVLAAPRHDRSATIQHVVENGGSGTFHCAWRHRIVKGLCTVSHQRIRTRDPNLVGQYGDGKSPSMLDAIVIRWPNGKVMRLVEGDDWEWIDLNQRDRGAYHSAYYWDGKDVDWSRGFVLLDDDWTELFRVW
jgi:hypothetical protein